jgi:hypothetical protein
VIAKWRLLPGGSAVRGPRIRPDPRRGDHGPAHVTAMMHPHRAFLYPR